MKDTFVTPSSIFLYAIEERSSRIQDAIRKNNEMFKGYVDFSPTMQTCRGCGATGAGASCAYCRRRYAE